MSSASRWMSRKARASAFRRFAWGGVEVRNLRITFGEMSIFEHWRLTREPALLIGMDVIGTLETFIIDYRRRELYMRARRERAIR